MEPSLGVDGLGRGLRTVPVAGHDPVAPNLDLAGLAHLGETVRLGHDPELVAGDGNAHRVQDHVHVSAGWGAEDPTRRLAHSIAGGAAVYVGGGQEALQHRCRHGGAAPGQLPDAGEVGLGELGMGGAELEHGWYAAPDPDPLLGDGGQQQRRVEPLLEDDGAAGDHLATADVADGSHVVDGQVADDLLGSGAACRRPGHPAPADATVGEQRPLGSAGAARCVDDEPGVHGLDPGPPFDQGVGVDRPAGFQEVVPAGCIHGDAALHTVDLGHQPVAEAVGSTGYPVEDDARSGVGDDVGHLAPRVLGVQALPDEADAGGGQEVDEEVEARVGEVGHPVSALQARRHQGTGHRVHLHPGLDPGESTAGDCRAAVDEELGIRLDGRPVVQVGVDAVQDRRHRFVRKGEDHRSATK